MEMPACLPAPDGRMDAVPVWSHFPQPHPQNQVVATIHTYLEELAKKMRAGEVPVREFAITKGLNKAPHEYPDAKAQPHLQARVMKCGVMRACLSVSSLHKGPTASPQPIPCPATRTYTPSISMYAWLPAGGAGDDEGGEARERGGPHRVRGL